jgi:hypothetical protein
MFRAPLCSSSGAQELYRWLLLVVHGAVKIENVTKFGDYWCLVSIMLSCVGIAGGRMWYLFMGSARICGAGRIKILNN